MSSKGRRKEFNDASQRDHDFFRTPGWSVRRLFEAYEPPGGRWLEPGAGDGSIIRATNRLDVRWTAVEIRRYAYFGLSRLSCGIHISDFFDYTSAYLDGMRQGMLSPFSVALGNPPYFLAREFIDAALSISKEVIFLLRLNFLGGDNRSSWLKSHYPDIFVLPNRVSGTADGRTDSTEYGWFRFRHTDWPYGEYRILNTTSVEERKLDYK